MHAFNAAVDNVRAGADAAEIAAGLYEQLTDDERLGLLDGDAPFWEGLGEMMGRYNGTPIVHGEVARLGIPGTRFVDGPRGCVAGNATAFPVSMARGATWDVDLEERVGRAIGAEIRVQGGNGPYAGEQFVCGFAVADVAAGQSVTVPVQVSLLPVGLWNPEAKRVEPAPASAVVLRIASQPTTRTPSSSRSPDHLYPTERVR